MTADELEALRPYMTPEERAEVDAILATFVMPLWSPLPGPQTLAFNSLADITGFGGAAGGGKTDLACGLALTAHEKTMILRENGTELTGVIDRLTELLKGRTGFNGQDKIWRTVTPDGRGRQIEFGSYPNPGDESKYQGRPHDLLVYDEASNHREAAVRFLMGWMRTTTRGQRCRALLTFNPPTNAEGRWIIEFFAPWLDRKHPKPAKPGELRWFATVEGKDMEVPDDRQFVLVGGERVYDFNPADFKSTEIIEPLSRTFIPSRVSDNPYLMGTGYVSTLQALPEPLRSQMLNGDFNAGIEDDAMQVIPTAWVDAAIARWKALDPKPPMDSIGVDVARGGRDKTVIARRHGMWFDEPIEYAGAQTPDGPKTAGYVIAAMRDNSPLHIDVIGIGSSPYDFLNDAGLPAIGVNVAEAARGMDKSGRLQFANLRTELWWRMREALDPTANNGIALPDNKQLAADLCAPTWRLRGGKIQVESRDEIIDRIGRSPDWASAYILALIDTPKIADLRRAHTDSGHGYDPYAYQRPRTTREHNPYS
ncbi:terminase [Paraburkholderia tropica]|uniref:terminase n=1 Tax=Paraburkholderia tropica TaxID=92647 RepID=UPI0032B5044A